MEQDNSLTQKIQDLRATLGLILDMVDYTNGACQLTEMVGAVLPKEVIQLARKRLEETD